MGWIILAVVLVLILLPFCVPLIIRVRWQGDEPEWSVHYGRLLVAPGGAENARAIFARWKQRFTMITKPFRPVGVALAAVFRLVFKVLLLLLKGLGVVAGVVASPVVFLLSAVRKRRAARRGDVDNIHDLENDEGTGFRAGDPGEEHTPAEPSPSEEHLTGGEFREDQRRTDETTGEAGFPTPDATEPGSPGNGEPGSSENGPFEESGSRVAPPGEDSVGTDESRFRKALRMLRRGRQLLSEYGPLGVRTLRLGLRVLRGYWRALRWRTLEVRISTGGDPVALGVASGWLYALDGAAGGALSSCFIFDPAYDDPTFSPRGSFTLDLRIIPIFFLPPTFGFLIRFPYLKWWRVVRTIRKERSDE